MLLVFVPMVIMSSVHVHAFPEKLPVECAHCHEHMHHAGHITMQNWHIDDCVQCRFLAQQYYCGISLTSQFQLSLVATITDHIGKKCPSVVMRSTMLRAPPAILPI